MNQPRLKIVNPKLGSDPELFLETDESLIIPACGLIGGSKDDPMPLNEDGYSIQEDNVMVEFNIPPATSGKDFVENITNGLRQVSTALPEGTRYKIKPSHLFTTDQLANPLAMIIGCDPDYDAWTNSVNVKEPLTGGLRSCGGHIHIGYDNPTIAANLELIKALDLYLGVPSILMDSDKLRKKMYGKAGCFRHKPYGVEYRTLSSFWLGSDKLIEWVWSQTMRAIDFVNAGDTIGPDLQEEIIHIINYGWEDKAFGLCARLDLTVI